jgi:translation initiation factor 4A
MCLGEYLKITCHTLTGGTNLTEDKKKLRDGVQVVIGTPGKVKDMINKKHLITDHIKIFVLDEADEMLSRGFKQQIADIL